MLSANLSAIFYLISGVLFILALRGLSSPETSRRGNFFGIFGMVIAITVTFLSIGNFSSGFIYVLIFLLIKPSSILAIFFLKLFQDKPILYFFLQIFKFSLAKSMFF